MSTTITRIEGDEAFDLIFEEHLSALPSLEIETMRRAMSNSVRCWVGTGASGQVFAVWGLIPPTLLSDRAYLWLYTTRHLQAHVFGFVRHSQLAVQDMLTQFPVIVGHARFGADKSIRWLRWLGAEFGEPQGQTIPFQIKAKQQWPQVLAV